MKTLNDVVTRALRRAGITAHDDAPTADQFQVATDILEGIIEETAVPFTSATIPDISFLPLSNWLARELSPDFEMSDQGRAREKLRLMATVYVDDRTDLPTDYLDAGYY